MEHGGIYSIALWFYTNLGWVGTILSMITLVAIVWKITKEED